MSDDHIARLDQHERELGRHAKALERIGTHLDVMGKEVHEVRVTLREKDETTKFLKSIFSAILVAVVLQLAGTVWWAAQLDSAVRVLTTAVSDHEARLRMEEQKK